MLRERMFAMARAVFDFDLQACLLSLGRDLVVLEHVTAERQVRPLEGVVSPLLVEWLSRMPESRAAYALNAGSRFPYVTDKVDALILSDEVLGFAVERREALMVHELCHAVIQHRAMHGVLGATSLAQRKEGFRLFRRTDVELARRTQHTRVFCTLLSTVATRAMSVIPSFSSAEDFVVAAMWLDLKDSPGFTGGAPPEEA